MTSALQWFVFIFSGYAIVMLLWAYKQSSYPQLQVNKGSLSTPIPFWKRTIVQTFFLLGSGAFILMPAMVYHYGVWGIVWLGLVLVAIPIYKLVSAVLSRDIFSIVRSVVRHQSVQTLRTIAFVIGAILLLTWQLLVMTDIIAALGIIPNIKMPLVLGFALLLLLSVSLAGDKILYYLSGIKLIILMLCCLAVALVLYAYIGGTAQFSGHINQFYGLPRASLEKTLLAALQIPKMPYLMLELSGGIALGFSLIVLMVMSDIGSEMSLASEQNTAQPQQSRFVKVMAGFMVVSALVLFVVYTVLLGFGTHFTGGDIAYSEASNKALSILFDPIASSALFPNLIVFFIQSLASIIPLMTAIFSVLILIILLSTSQILLYQAGRLMLKNLLIPSLKLLRFDDFEDKASRNKWQRRSYAVMLMIVMGLSQI